MLRTIIWGTLLATLAACTSGASTPGTSIGAAQVRQGFLPGSGSCCNISWNKKRLNLRYDSKPTMDAVLTYWAPNGYYLTPFYCQNGSQIIATPGRSKGSPSGYMRVKYSFTTQSPGPDDCAVDAVLNNTGSPPIAILKIRIK